MDFVGADVHCAIYDPGESCATLISGQGLLGGGIDGQGVAALVDGRAVGDEPMVWVGPPLSANVSSPGLMTPTWLLLTPLVRPPEPPVPIKLYALDEATVPATSLADAPMPVPSVFSAMIVLSTVATPKATSRPPPGAAVGDVVVGDSGVGIIGQRTTAFVDAAAAAGLDPPANRIGVSVGRVVGDGGVSDGHRAIAKMPPPKPPSQSRPFLHATAEL